MHVIAAKAVAFGEALEPGFKSYARAVIANAKALAGRLKDSSTARVRLRSMVSPSRTERGRTATLLCSKRSLPRSRMRE
jgi:hypothetical protein